jgi:hypothetical protein
MDPTVKIDKPILQACLIVLPRDAIDPGGSSTL